MLRSAHRAGTVQHVVLTSSFAALQDYHADQAPGGNADKVYTEDDWCPLTWQEAKETDDQLLVYVASKKFAEKAAWDFVEQEKPAFVLTTCVPSSRGPRKSSCYLGAVLTLLVVAASSRPTSLASPSSLLTR